MAFLDFIDRALFDMGVLEMCVRKCECECILVAGEWIGCGQL